MRIAILSDPNNFHTQKWAKALENAGADVVVMSFDTYEGSDLMAIQLKPPIGRNGKYSYLDYLRGGKVLNAALKTYKIDVLNPLNITPFGVWAMQSRFKPVIACAFGADILEYPPKSEITEILATRGWDAQDLNVNGSKKWIQSLKRRYYRKKVAEALQYADLITGDNQFLVDCMANWFAVPPSKLRLLRWGVEPELFDITDDEKEALKKRFGIQAGQKVVLSPRGAKPLYQADIILNAFELALHQHPSNVKFIMLGAGYLISSSVSQKAEKMMKSFPNFLFVPEVLARETLYGLWNFVDIFISAPIYDGYSAALAEGRYIGAIPIVNPIPAHEELIIHNQNGWISTPFTSEQVAKDLDFILENISSIKPKFALENRKWILAESLMHKNALTFLQECLMVQQKTNT